MDIREKRRYKDFIIVGIARIEKQIFWSCECIHCGCHRQYTLEYLERMQKKEGGVRCPYCLGEYDYNYSIKRRKLYRAYIMMKHRCYKETDPSYKWYGARGIKVYDEWKDDFNTFYDYISHLEHFGEEGRSLDRINNDGDYCPGNVRWATSKEQSENRRQRRKNIKELDENEKV